MQIAEALGVLSRIKDLEKLPKVGDVPDDPKVEVSPEEVGILTQALESAARTMRGCGLTKRIVLLSEGGVDWIFQPTSQVYEPVSKKSWIETNPKRIFADYGYGGAPCRPENALTVYGLERWLALIENALLKLLAERGEG